MTAYSADVRRVLQSLKLDCSVLSNEEFDAIVREAVKMAPQIAGLISGKNAGAIVGKLESSGAMKVAVNNLASRNTRLAQRAKNSRTSIA